MAEETIATVPSGTQTTWNNPLGPQPSKSGAAEKFRKAFQELTHEDVKPKGEAPVEPPKEDAPPPATESKEPVKTEEVTSDKIPDKKPESPLDAVLAKPKEIPVEEPDVLKEFDEKTANWQKARQVMKTQSEELKSLREKVKTVPQADPSVIEALTKERDEIRSKYEDQERKLKAVNYRYSDEYQALVQDKEKLVSKISNRVKSYGGDEKSLIEALKLPESRVRTSQIKEALAEVDPDDRPRIYALMEQLEAQDEKLADAEKQADVKFDELSTKRSVEKAEQSQNVVKEIETNFIKAAEAIPVNTITMREVPDDVPGAAEWNAAIRQAHDTALKVLKPGGADFNMTAAIALKGARYDSFEKWALGMYADYTDLKQKYQEAVGSGPDFKGGQKPAPQVEKKPGVKYREALAMAHGAGSEI